MNAESRKLIDLLNTATDYFAGKQIDHPRRNAEALLGKALSLPRIELYLQHDRPLRSEEVGLFREYVRRRANREPLQQILGQVEFFGCRIKTARGVLVPRPETEQLVEKVVIQARSRFGLEEPIRILDLGCGSGCIAIALARTLPNARVDGVEIDSAAAALADENASLNGVEARITIHCADFFDDGMLGPISPPYDIVVSNPPYVRESDFETLTPEIRNFESPRALIGGPDGLDCYRRIASLLPKLLGTGGFAAFELGIDQAEAVRGLLTVDYGVDVIEDWNGIRRFLFVDGEI